MVHVVSEKMITLMGTLRDYFRDRETFAVASMDLPSFSFGQWQDPETFIINLQSQFVQTDDLLHVLKIVGNMKAEAVKHFNDDGVTQSVTARSGIALVDNLAVPNPVTLVPYRTFREIMQPPSFFVFRLRNGGEGKMPSCALFEADGSSWRLDAIEGIAEWLRKELGETATIIA